MSNVNFMPCCSGGVANTCKHSLISPVTLRTSFYCIDAQVVLEGHPPNSELLLTSTSRIFKISFGNHEHKGLTDLVDAI